MRRIFLASYTLRVAKVLDIDTEILGAKPFLKVDNFDGQNADLFTVLVEFLTLLKSTSAKDEKNQKVISVEKVEIEGRTIKGIIKTGDFGFESTLRDVDSDTLSYERKVRDAEFIPFYFRIEVPKGKNEAILILQRFGTLGIRGDFEKCLIKHFKLIYGEYEVSIHTLISQQLIEEYLSQGIVKKIRLVRFSIPSDITDALDGGHNEEDGYTELVVVSKDLQIFKRIAEVFQDKRKISQLVELHETKFEYDTVKIEVNIRGSSKTINLSNWLKVRNYIDITEDVIINVDGHPQYTSIDDYCRDYVKDFLYKIYLKPTAG
jgi:hypothetical protein